MGEGSPKPAWRSQLDKEFYRDLLDQISDGVYFVTRDTAFRSP